MTDSSSIDVLSSSEKSVKSRGNNNTCNNSLEPSNDTTTCSSRNGNDNDDSHIISEKSRKGHDITKRCDRRHKKISCAVKILAGVALVLILFQCFDIMKVGQNALLEPTDQTRLKPQSEQELLEGGNTTTTIIASNTPSARPLPPSPSPLVPSLSSLESSETTLESPLHHVTPEKHDNSVQVLDLPEDFHICRIENPSPIYGQPPLLLENSTLFQSIGMAFRYQCAGPPYDEFLQHHQFPWVLRRHQQDPTLQWGKRPTVVPPPTKKNQNRSRHVLIMGNSHTRQMAGALLCQYHDQIVSHQTLPPTTAKDVHAVQYQLQDNLTISVLINHPFAYSPRWKTNLEQIILQQPLSELDAIVLGPFNRYYSKFDAMALWRIVKQYGRDFPLQQVDPIQYRTAIPIRSLAKVYPKPIVWHSMLAYYSKNLNLKTNEEIHNLTATEGRTNLRSIDARQYISQMEGAAECSSNSGTVVGTCITDRQDSNYRDGHRCMGNRGGQPDLLAWDIVEALWDVLLLSADVE